MGQTRTDSNQQLAAKRRGAERRRCPNCKRGNALSQVVNEFVRGRYCRYCDYERGIDLTTHEPFERFPR